jgi:hypothetical protein
VKLTSKKTFTEILHILIALELTLAYLYVLNLFKPSYFILIRGVVWAHDYEFKLLGRDFYGLTVLIVIALTLAICLYKAGGFKAVKPSRLALYVLTALIFINIPPLIYWTLYALDPNPLEYSLRQYVWVSEFDASIFHVYAPAYPILILATLYAWLLPVISKAFKSRVRLSVRCSKALGKADEHRPSNNMFIERFGLALVLLLSIALPLMPYLPSINPDFKPVSVDIRIIYSTFLNNMPVEDVYGAVEYAFCKEGTRPLYLLLLYALTKTGLPKQIVLNLESTFTSPLFALAVYFSAKRLSGSNLYALLAALAGVLGFNMTVNMIAGFYANWMAISLLYACIALIPSLKEGNPKDLLWCVVISAVMLYIHPWTWNVFIAILIVYLIFSTSDLFKTLSFKQNKYLFIVLMTNALADLLRSIFTPYGGLNCLISTLGGGFGSRGVGFNNLINLTWNLCRLSTTYLGATFYNPLHMLLALIGILSLLKHKDELSKLIIIWIATTSAIFLFGDIVLRSRLLLVMPLPILIAEGLWALSKLLASFDSKLPKLFIIFFIVSSLTYTVRALCNLI